MNIVESSANSVTEETRKRPRLSWGEGLAKFEKKKTEGDGVSAATTATPASCACNSFSGILLDSINYSLLWSFVLKIYFCNCIIFYFLVFKIGFSK